MKKTLKKKTCRQCSKAFQVPARRGRTSKYCSPICRTAYRRKYTANLQRENTTTCPGCKKAKYLEEYEKTCSKWCEEVVKLMEGYDGAPGLTREEAELVANVEGWPKTKLPHRPRINNYEQLLKYDLAPVTNSDGTWSHGDYRIVTCDSDFDSYEESTFGVRDWIADNETPYARLNVDPEAKAWAANNPNWASKL